MNRLSPIFWGALALLAFASPVHAAGPYTQNTAGTTADGQLEALSDVVDSLLAATPAGENFVGSVGGKSSIAACTVTRPDDTDAYASGDLVANDVDAMDVVPCSLTVARVDDGTGMIRRVRLTAGSTSLTNASFRIHFYSTCTIAAANGDNGAWSTDGAADYAGAADVTLDKAFTDGAFGIGTPNAGSEINFVAVSGAMTLCALIEARAAYTPVANGIFAVAVEVLQN